MEALPVRRVHIDSRFKDDSSDSHSDFSIRLSQSVQLPEDAVCLVDHITIPNTFKTISSINDSLYVAEQISATNVLCRKITLAHGYHNASQYAAALKDALNSGTPAVMGSAPYNAIFQPQQGNVAVSGHGSYNFVILSDEQIQRFPAAGHASPTGTLTINQNDTASGNAVLRNLTNGNSSSDPLTYVFGTLYQSGFLDLLPVHTAFIHSSLADNCVMTPLGMSDCIAACPISASTGEVVHHNITSAADAINVSKRSFDTLSFQLRNAKGQICDLAGASWSCSLLFVQKI